MMSMWNELLRRYNDTNKDDADDDDDDDDDDYNNSTIKICI